MIGERSFLKVFTNSLNTAGVEVLATRNNEKGIHLKILHKGNKICYEGVFNETHFCDPLDLEASYKFLRSCFYKLPDHDVDILYHHDTLRLTLSYKSYINLKTTLWLHDSSKPLPPPPTLTPPAEETVQPPPAITLSIAPEPAQVHPSEDTLQKEVGPVKPSSCCCANVPTISKTTSPLTISPEDKVAFLGQIVDVLLQQLVELHANSLKP